jgi:hypothetical protein
MNSIKIDKWGNKRHFLNDLLHREDGPAIEWIDGGKSYYQRGQRHRLDGPAIEYVRGAKWWYFHGKYIDCDSQEEFEEQIKLAVFW